MKRQSVPRNPELLSPKEAAAFLGISTRTLARLRAANKLLPVYPSPGKPYYLRGSLHEYLTGAFVCIPQPPKQRLKLGQK